MCELNGMQFTAVELRRRNECETVERISSGYFEIVRMHLQGNFFGKMVNPIFRCQDNTALLHLRRDIHFRKV